MKAIGFGLKQVEWRRSAAAGGNKNGYRRDGGTRASAALVLLNDFECSGASGAERQGPTAQITVKAGSDLANPSRFQI